MRQPDNESWKKKIYEIQKNFLGKSLTIDYADQERLTQRLTCKLETIRQRFSKQRLVAEQLVKSYDSAVVDPSVDAKFYECMKAISIDCSEVMVGFAGNIIRESVLILKEHPPCDFQGVAIGSLARGEATPYSDLEYLFLIEKKSADTEAYFEKLAIASYFLMGNLKETKLSYVAIEELSWFDDESKNGFKIDGLTTGAGNIPTGNGLKEKKNHFIVTPEELARTFKQIHDSPTKEALRGDLTAMLTFTQLIYSHGENDLLSEVKGKIGRFVPNQTRKDTNLTMLKEDAKKFKVVTEDDLNLKGLTANVKKEFYRFPSIILLDIIIVFGQRSKTSWYALEDLVCHGKISRDVGAVLRFCLAAAVYIRLSAYLYHDSHNDRISLSDSIEKLQAVRRSVYQLWFLPAGLYSRVCAQITPLKASLSESKTKVNDLKTIAIPPQTELELFLHQYFSFRYYDALDTLKQIGKGDPQHALRGPKSYMWVGLVMHTLALCKHYNSVIDLYRCSAKIIQRSGFLQCDSWKIIAASALSFLGRFSEAIGLLKTVKESSSAATQLNLVFAEVYQAKGDYFEVEKHQLRVIQLETNRIFSENLSEPVEYYGSLSSSNTGTHIDLTDMPPEEVLKIQIPPSPSTILSLLSLGQVYFWRMKKDLGKSYALRGLELVEQLYGKNAAVPLAAACLVDLGNHCSEQGDYHEAEIHFKRALTIHKRISHTGERSNIAQQIYNLAWINLQQEHYGAVERYSNKSLAMYRKVKEQDETRVEFHAKAFSNKAVAEIFNHNLYRAVEYLQHSLHIMAGSTEAAFYLLSRGYTLYWLGSCYRMQHKYREALDKYKEAWYIYRSVWPGHKLIRHMEVLLLCKPGPLNQWPVFTPSMHLFITPSEQKTSI